MARGGQVHAVSPDVDTEVEALRRQAAQLRASATTLEEEQEAQRRLENERCFRKFDRDGSEAVDAEELRLGLKDLWGMELEEDVSARLLKLLDVNGSGAIELEEFDVVTFRPTLERLRREDAAREEARAAEEAKRQEELELERQMEEYRRSLPGENQDTGILTRLLSVAVYFLPLMDALKLGMPLALVLPPAALDVLLSPLVPLYRAGLAFPFASLITFLAMQYFAGREDLPALARFNMRQAVQLDLVISLLTLVSHEGPLFEALADWVGMAVFLPGVAFYFFALASVAYSVALSLCGEAPRGVPKISEDAEKAMGMVPPGSEDSEKQA